MAAALPWVKPQFPDSNGDPVAGGKVWTYQAGTSTPVASFTDSTGLVPNTNPVILDAAGRGDIWLAPGSYKVVLMDANDVVLWTKDKVKPADGAGGGIVDSDYVFSGFSVTLNKSVVTTGLSDSISQLLNLQYTGPTISLSATGNGTIREKGTSVASTTLSALITKKSDPIANVKFYQGATLLTTLTGTIPAGGTESYVYSTPFTDNISFSATATDNAATGGPTTVTSGASFTFVYPYYYGAGVSGKTAAQVAALTKSVIVSTATVNVTMTASASNVFYFAYPASYGALTSILDVNNFETIADWTASTANITGLDGAAVSYKIYQFNNPVVAGSYFYSFRR